jgi:hypothetical protein
MTATRVLSPFAVLLRMASRIICLIVIVSFALFAIEQTSNASTHQQEALSGTNGGPTAAATPVVHPARKGTLHKAIDEAAGKLTSPFSGITTGSSSQWVIRGVGTMMALLVYGVGLGYIARLVRIRV